MSNWVEHPELVEFYSTQRSRPEDLYPSEERFLPGLAREAATVLDVGCGAGGFVDVWRHYNPRIDYTGVDASAALIEAAHRIHPDAAFVRADGVGPLPFTDRSFDVVAGLGWLHLEPRYRDALHELWRVTGGCLFFDLRLHAEVGADVVGTQRLALSGEWDGETRIPYIVASWPDAARALLALEPARITAHGYQGKPAGTVDGVPVSVTFATFVLERGAASGPAIAGDLPLEWPA